MNPFLIVAVFAASCIVATVEAHACLLIPAQRGDIPDAIYKYAGDITCLHVLQAPCGDMPVEDPKVSYKPGQNSYVSIMKNLDHYCPHNPGNWEVFLWVGDATEGKSLVEFPDSDDFKTLETKAVNITIPPDTQSGKAFIQLIYTPNNPQVPKKFYQCADVMIE